jgi:hypothetical protein
LRVRGADDVTGTDGPAALRVVVSVRVRVAAFVDDNQEDLLLLLGHVGVGRLP